MSCKLSINGKPFKVNPKEVPINTSLNTYIRNHVQLKGTKFMCLEGGCGACMVTVTSLHPVTKVKESYAVNSCLMPVYCCDGYEITTVEGLGNRKDGYHPIQERLTHFKGSQCGYCTPGMVMNMYSLLEANDGKVSMAEIENSFGGNICRCTGYRPILDAFKSLANDADQKYVDFCGDIEDLDKICPTTGVKCSGKCDFKSDMKVNSVILSDDDSKIWCNFTTVKEIFDKFSEIGSRKYMLIAGNTAHGVYRRDPNIEIFLNIRDVRELRVYSIAEELILGGNVTLNEMIRILTEASSTNSNFQYCKEMADYMKLVANVSIRNFGTLAGNLMIKHQHNEFPSDIFNMLETVGARIKIADSLTRTRDYNLIDFLGLSMNKKVIMSVLLPQLDPTLFTYRGYKIMPRAQHAHAYVNAGFLAHINGGLIESMKICYGGINPHFIHATVTERSLVGKDLHDDTTLQNALQSLNNEVNPDWVLPDASVEYRKNLALALFYKFVLNTCPESRVKPEYKSGGNLLQRPLSTGQQTYETIDGKFPLTKDIPKLESKIQCSGEAEYVNDYPNLPNQLWAALVPATRVNWKIAKIDASEALAIPGVFAFYSATDIPGLNDFTDSKLFFIPLPEEIFCSGDVLYHSQPAGMILADTFDKAQYASTKVKIMYEKELESTKSIIGFASSFVNSLTGRADKNIEVVPTLKEIFAKNDNDRIIEIIDKEELSINDLKENDLNQTRTVQGLFQMNGQYHYSLETLTTVCNLNDNCLDVYCSTQWITGAVTAISKSTKLPQSAINMHVKRLGGGFGLKISRASFSAAVCAIGCVLSNRPVRFVMTIEENMSAIGKRCPCYCNYTAAVEENGKIVSVNNEYTTDAGCSLNEVPDFYIDSFFGNCYNRAGWSLKGNKAVTDSASNTWCRSPGTLEGIAMTEYIMDHIAWETNQDAADVRMINMLDDNPIKKLMPEFLRSIDYHSRQRETVEFNRNNRWVKRGMSLSPVQFFLQYIESLSALVAISHIDGTVAITHGAIEMGQGVNTKVAQVASHTLGVPMEYIIIKSTNDLDTKNSFLTGGSIGTDTACYAVLRACEELNRRLQPVKDSMAGAAWDAVVHSAHAQFISLICHYHYKAPDLNPYLCYVIAVAEIEIDILTGNSQLLRVDILEDTGESLNPAVDVGQVEGGFIMGLGYWLTEKLVYHRETGELLTNRSWNYKPPGFKDIPIDFRIHLLQKTPNPLFVLRSKAVGEPPICASIVVLFAARQALKAAREDAGITDWFHLGAPTTVEDIFLASGNSIDQFKLMS